MLGPAIDGGYYLICLRRSFYELFTNIDWGTNRVLQQTIDIAQKLNLSVVNLQTLADVERQSDLPVWEKILQ